MNIVSSRDFRRSQKRYLDQIALMSKAAFYEQVETAIEDAKAGRTFAMLPDESLDDFMLRMEAAGNV